ncbi:RidA family protein [Mycolicibacterium palauense]|uniref:RidA family protein n=1 Tax=Mycolicibacterium palauense TaxID=2034511 RepID=UPI000BFEBA42|nr:RidA family protein [Mycolicibacterium palauense]
MSTDPVAHGDRRDPVAHGDRRDPVAHGDRRDPVAHGDYLPAVCHGDLVYTAGMTPRRDGELVVTGVVGAGVPVPVASAAAGLAAENALAAVRWALPPGDTEVRCLRMTVYVACAPGFVQLSAVADGASETIRRELGARALPARTAVGVQSLPSGAPVEVELVAARGAGG